MAVGSGASHQTARIVHIACVCDESDDDVDVSAVTFYRNRQKYDTSDGYSVGFAQTVGTSTELELDQVIPAGSVIIITPTFQA